MSKLSPISVMLLIAMLVQPSSSSAADFGRILEGAMLDKQRSIQAAAVRDQRINAPAPAQVKPLTPVQPTQARLENIPPVSLSKSLQRQSEAERTQVAQAIAAEIENLKAELAERLAITPRTPALEAQIAAVNEALSAKRQAYDLALGVTTSVSNAGAESFANTVNPYFLICANAIWAPKDPIRWIDQIQPQQKQLLAAGRSVGLIELAGEPRGTGFVVGNMHVLTNLHVLKTIAKYNQTKRVWVVEDKAKITFDVEFALGTAHNCDEPNVSRSYFINGVFAVPQGDDPDDLAVLLTARDDNFPPALKVVVKPPESYPGNMRVAVIGYPGPPRDMTVAETMEFFRSPSATNPVYPWKRLSTGFTGDQKVTPEGRFVHKANTTAGNSGSPVFDLNDGAVVGVHVAGSDRRFDSVLGYNEAITSHRAHNLLVRSGLVKQ